MIPAWYYYARISHFQDNLPLNQSGFSKDHVHFSLHPVSCFLLPIDFVILQDCLCLQVSGPWCIHDVVAIAPGQFVYLQFFFFQNKFIFQLLHLVIALCSFVFDLMNGSLQILNGGIGNGHFFFSIKLAALHLLIICSQTVYSGSFFIQHLLFFCPPRFAVVPIVRCRSFKLTSLLPQSAVRVNCNAFIDSLYLAFCFL